MTVSAGRCGSTIIDAAHLGSMARRLRRNEGSSIFFSIGAQRWLSPLLRRRLALVGARAKIAAARPPRLRRAR